MKKQTKHQYDNMMQVYRKMHEEVDQLAQQVLELDDEKLKLSTEILYDVAKLLGNYYSIVMGLDWILKLNNDKKFLESCFMFLHGYIEEDDVYEAWYRYLDKKQDLNSYFYYILLLYINHILPL